MTTAFAARHSMDSPEWYTPSLIVEAAREVMGAIDLDPASHEEANVIIKARQFFTKEDNGLRQMWRGRVFLNPPGGDKLPQQFWRLLVDSYHGVDADDLDAHVEQAIWIGYSLEQLQTLQHAHVVTPLNFSMCIPRRRIAFIENEAKARLRQHKIEAENVLRRSNNQPLKRAEKAASPSHANYISYLGPNTAIFARVFSQFGQVVTR